MPVTLTIETWVRAETENSGVIYDLGNVKSTILNGNTVVTFDGEAVELSNPVVPIQAWSNISISLKWDFDAKLNTVNIYIDNQSGVSTSLQGTDPILDSSSSGKFIGRDNGGSEFYTGFIYQLRIYSIVKETYDLEVAGCP
jgi:hypothetical protein